MSHYSPYPAYKNSGVEWIGQIPEHWILHKLKYITRFSGGGTPSRDNLDFWGGDIPWISPKDMKHEIISEAEENISEAGLRNSTTSLIHPGEVLLVVRSGILKHTIPIAVNDVEVSLNQDMKALRLDKNFCSSHFFLRWVQGFNKNLLQMWLKQGATVESIEQEFLAETVLPLPSTLEQNQILFRLNNETLKIAELINKKSLLIDLLHEKRQALIGESVINGLNQKSKTKDSRVYWIGDIPEHWSACKLSLRYYINLGKMLDEKKLTKTNLFPYLRNQDVQWDAINTHNLPEMDIHPHELQRYSIRKGDLMVCEGGDVARAAIWQGANNVFGYQKALHRLRPRSDKTDIASFFFFVLLTAKKRGVFEENDSKATIAHLPAEKFRQYHFAFPPLEEQKEIVEYIHTKTAKIDKLISKTKLSINLLKERRTALITAAVTGQIDLREAP
ncbi:type I restriction enzyme S subunit [Pseudomonas brenneri]|nr:type I restriction enzyme S subunit [Pseudomonas brenneri]